jgi:pentapeptide MXKDX repeat protein
MELIGFNTDKMEMDMKKQMIIAATVVLTGLFATTAIAEHHMEKQDMMHGDMQEDSMMQGHMKKDSMNHDKEMMKEDGMMKDHMKKHKMKHDKDMMNNDGMMKKENMM